jgi:hypothetical protein
MAKDQWEVVSRTPIQSSKSPWEVVSVTPIGEEDRKKKEEEDETVKGGELMHLCASGGCSGLQSGRNCKQHMTTHRHAQLHARARV